MIETDNIFVTPTRSNNLPWEKRCNAPTQVLNSNGQVPITARLQSATSNERNGEGAKLAMAAKRVLAVLTTRKNEDENPDSPSRFTVAIAKMSDGFIYIAYNIGIDNIAKYPVPWKGFPLADLSQKKYEKCLEILKDCKLIDDKVFNNVKVLINPSYTNHMKVHAEMQLTR